MISGCVGVTHEQAQRSYLSLDKLVESKWEISVHGMSNSCIMCVGVDVSVCVYTLVVMQQLTAEVGLEWLVRRRLVEANVWMH